MKFRFHPSQYTVKLGEFNLNEPDVGESGPYRVVTIKIHQRFIYRGFYNDLALFKLDRLVEFSNYIQPICLPTGTMRNENFVGESGVIAGWGTTSYGKRLKFRNNLLNYLPDVDIVITIRFLSISAIRQSVNLSKSAPIKCSFKIRCISVALCRVNCHKNNNLLVAPLNHF